MQSVKLYYNRILQFLTRMLNNTGWSV